MSAQPWMKFFPTDWRADPKLRMCSLAARGLWMEMLCVMHEAIPRGTLKVGDKAILNRHLANLVGVTEGEAITLLGELEEADVFSRDDNGVIFSRRMRREAEVSAKAREWGKDGGNPALKSSLKAKDKDRPNPYIASGSSISEETQTDQEEASPRAREFAESFWPSFPNHVDEKRATEAFDAARDKATLEEIMAGLGRYKAAKPSDREWMNPVTFLDNERWKDRPALTNGAVTTSTPSKPVHWVEVDDHRWDRLAARWSIEHSGKFPNPVGSKHGTGVGFHFPADWLSPS